MFTLFFRSAALFAAALLLGTAAEAQVFRCKMANGKTTYADSPCGDKAEILIGDESGSNGYDPNLTKSERQALEDRRRQKAEADAAISRANMARQLEYYEKPKREQAERDRVAAIQRANAEEAQRAQAKADQRDQLAIETNNRLIEIQRAQAAANAAGANQKKKSLFCHGVPGSGTMFCD